LPLQLTAIKRLSISSDTDTLGWHHPAWPSDTRQTAINRRRFIAGDQHRAAKPLPYERLHDGQSGHAPVNR